MDPLPPPGPPGPGGPAHPPRTAAPTSPQVAPRAVPPTAVMPPNVSSRSTPKRVWPTVVGVLAIVVAAAIAGGGFAAVVHTRAEPEAVSVDASDVLADARRFLHAQKTVQFDFTGSVSFVGLDEFKASVLTGSYASVIPARARMLVDDGQTITEAIDIDGTRYERTAPSDRSLDGVLYEKESADTPVIAGGYDFRTLLDDVTDPQVLSEARGVTTVLATDNAPRSFFDDTLSTFGNREVIVAVANNGEVRSITLQIQVEDLAIMISANEVRWGDALIIDEPRESEIDLTPGIDEGRLAAFTDAPVLAPTHAPAGWTLDGATILDPENTVEHCEQGHIAYSSPESGDTLDLFSLPVSCATATPPANANPITLAGGWGWIATVDNVTQVEIVVGTTLLQVHTTLSIDHAVQVLASVAVFDPASPPPPDLVFSTTS